MTCCTRRWQRSALAEASRNSATGSKVIRLCGKWRLWINRRSAARRVRIPPPISRRSTRSEKHLPIRPIRNGAATAQVIFLSTCREAAAKPARATARSRWRCSFWRTSNFFAKSAGGRGSRAADWLIDLGPEGGDQGGKIIATGTPEQVARNTQSHTGHFLSRVLNGNGQAKRPANGASKPAGPSATISNGAKIPPAEP